MTSVTNKTLPNHLLISQLIFVYFHQKALLEMLFVFFYHYENTHIHIENSSPKTENFLIKKL